MSDDEPSTPDAADQGAAPDAASGETAEVERLLLRSATLDVGGARAKERALGAGLEALAKPRGGLVKLAGAGVVLAAAAAVALSLAPKAPRFAAREIVPPPEPPAPSAGPTRPALPPPVLACPELVIARGDAPLIEDFEGNDSRVLPRDGRSGGWMTYDDETGTQSPPGRSALFPSKIPGGRGKSHYGLHVTGGKFTLWGVTFGAELADASCYDASAYAGVHFWAKGPGTLLVGLQMIDVQDVKYGGLCQRDCYNSHRARVSLGKTFEHKSVRWEELHQLFDGGPPTPFDPRRIRFIEFGVAAEDTPFDVWIDDVSFLRRDAAPAASGSPPARP